MKIAVINENGIHHTEQQMTHAYFTLDNIEDLLEDYIEYKNINENELIDFIMDTIGVDFSIHTGVVSHVMDTLYQIIHIDVMKETHDEIIVNHKLNGIATYLTDTNLPVFGRAIMIKIDTSSNKNTLVNLYEHDIYDLYRGKFIHKGVQINENGNMDDIAYVYNPVDWISPDRIGSYKYDEAEILGKVFMVFYDMNSQSNINPIAHKMIKHNEYPIKGTIIIGMRDKQEFQNEYLKYLDITKKEMQKLLKVIDSGNITLRDDEDCNMEISKDTNKRIYTNFYKILANR